MRNHFSLDPYWMTARFKSLCACCKQAIKKGEKILYYPNGKTVYCRTCGQSEWDRFTEEAELEYWMTGPIDEYEMEY